MQTKNIKRLQTWRGERRIRIKAENRAFTERGPKNQEVSRKRLNREYGTRGGKIRGRDKPYREMVSRN